MGKNYYLKMLVEDIHSTTIATIGADGHPQTRVIDMMLWDENGVYFLTAKGKAFYTQMMEQRYIAVSATKDKKAVSLRDSIVIGQAEILENGYFVGDQCNGCKLCDSVCPQKCIDISVTPVVIDQNRCLHCGSCAKICPKQTIEKRG